MRVNVRTSIKTQSLHHINLTCGCFAGLDTAGDPCSSSFQRSFFFGIVPRLQLHLPLGFVGGAYERSGWCFVEACAVSCEHLTQTESLVTHLCFFRVSLMRSSRNAETLVQTRTASSTEIPPFEKCSVLSSVQWRVAAQQPLPDTHF